MKMKTEDAAKELVLLNNKIIVETCTDLAVPKRINALKLAISKMMVLTQPRILQELKNADEEICGLCKRLNPQHENCDSCDDRDSRLRVIEEAQTIEVED